MRVLLTQTAEDTAASVAALESRGHQVTAIPLVTAERAPPPKINLTSAQGFLVTSAEGARALADHVGVRTFPVFADSDVTADALRRVGFKHIETAKDDSADLARLVERTLKPANGALIYACSTAAPVNLSAMLSNMGFAVRPLPLYTIKRAAQAPAAFHETLENKSVDTALFLTPEEARAFVALVQQDKLEAQVRTLTAVAATPVVAAPLRALKLGGVIVPAAADLGALFDALGEKLVDKVEEERAERARRAKETADAEAERERIAAERAAAERAAAEKAEAARVKAEEERRAQEQAEKERVVAEKIAAEQAAQERRAAEKAEKERIAREKAEAARAEKERLARERAEKERIAAERAAAEKVEREKLAAEKAERDRIERARLAAEKAEKERIAAERAAAEKAEHEKGTAERVEQDRIARERLATERAEKDRMAREKAAAEKAERERLAAERAEQERIARVQEAAARAERERIAREQIALAESEQERLELEKAEVLRQAREKAAAEKAELDRVAREKAAAEKAERKKLAAERADQARVERERLAAERAEQDRIAREKAAAEKAERDRLAAERTEQERIARERLAAEKAEQARVAKEAAEAERAAQRQRAEEQAERERLERERLAAERQERERIAREAAEAEKAARRRAKEEEAQRKRDAKERAAAEKAEQRRKAEDARARLKAERAEAQAQTQPRDGLGKRVMGWFAARRAAPDTPSSAAWNMPVDSATDLGAADSTSSVAQTPSSVTMPVAIAASPPVQRMQAPEPEALLKSDNVKKDGSQENWPQTKETKDVSEPLPPPTPPATPPAEPQSDKPALRGGGRAARLLAEDAADERAKDQRFKYLGHSDAPQPEPESASFTPPPSQARGSVARTIGLFVVLAAMAAVVVSTASWWVPRVTSLVQSTPTEAPAPTAAATTTDIAPTLEADITALKARVAVLEQEAVNTVTPDALNTARQEIAQRLSALETRAGVAQDGEAVTSLGESLSSQAKQLTAVSARLATLEAAIGNTARLEDLSNRLNMLEGRTAEAHSVLALSDRVTALETTGRRTMVEQSANIALLMAVGQWRDALQAGRPFALELQTAKALAAKIGAATIDDSAFAATASKGLATFADLQRQFGPTAAAAMRASAMPEGTSAWYRRILDRMLAIVTVRRLDGDAAGTGTAAILARAEARLNEGNLAGAVREMNGLSGDAATAATAWQTQAAARVAAESAASDATTKAVAAIAAADTAPETTPGTAPGTSVTTTPSAAPRNGQ